MMHLHTLYIAAITAGALIMFVEGPHAYGQNDGRVSHVTLYRNQAMVTRTIDIQGEAGNREVVVGNLPENIVADSLFAEGTADIEVRAAEFRTRAVGDSPREEVRELQAEIQVVADNIALNQKQTEILAKQSAYLDQLEGFVAPTATAELSKGVLDAEALERVTTFSFQQRDKIAQRQIELAKEQRQLQDQHTLLQRKLGEITNGSTKTVREAVLFLSKTGEGDQQLRLNYLVNDCGWSPTYTIRSGGDRSKAQLEYNGLIHQMSGEDWKDVSFSLSTASPALSAAGPGLAPLRVTLINSAAQQGQTLQFANPSKGQLEQIVTKQQSANRAILNATNYRDMNESNWSLNDAANELACVMLIGDSGVVSTLREEIEKMTDEPSLIYQLQNTVSLPSRKSRQMVRIVSTDLPSEFYHVATPVLTSYVYREAQVTNNSSEDFLSGPITVYMDGKFVGRGEIPTVARGQSFVVGFGADPQLRSRRELAEKVDGIAGGNRELKFDYRLVVENFKDNETPIRVVDRIPTTTDGADIRVTTGAFSDDLSENETYLRVERPEGILRWDIDVPAKAVAEGARVITYSFTVEYDRNYMVSLPDSLNQLKQDFLRLQRERSIR